MRARYWALITVILVLGALAIGVSGCASRNAGGPANTPVPSKTLRPTFTPTVSKPEATPTVAEAQTGGEAGQPAPTEMVFEATVKPTETLEPTPEPSPTPEPAAFTVSSASINVRGGPGTNYPVLGRLSQGQSFPITGKSTNGDWWQFDYDGRTGWVISTNVTTTGAESVQVAQNIPAPPAAAPRPTARPAAPQPAQPPAQPAQPPPAATKFGVAGTGFQPNTNELITVYCILYNQAGTGLLPGTMRVSRDGQALGTASFSDQATYYLSSGYNAGCKVETVPAVNGTYTAVLVEGDTVVSDPITFTITGPENRIQFAAWKQR